MPGLQRHINKEVQDDIKNLYNHAEVANKEMGIIKTDIAVLKEEIRFIVKQNWVIIAAIIGLALKVILNK